MSSTVNGRARATRHAEAKFGISRRGGVEYREGPTMGSVHGSASCRQKIKYKLLQN